MFDDKHSKLMMKFFIVVMLVFALATRLSAGVIPMVGMGVGTSYGGTYHWKAGARGHLDDKNDLSWIVLASRTKPMRPSDIEITGYGFEVGLAFLSGFSVTNGLTSYYSYEDDSYSLSHTLGLYFSVNNLTAGLTADVQGRLTATSMLSF